MSENFYTILGCTQESTYQEIKRNYHRLVKENHPDRTQSPDFGDNFHKIDEAWKTLRDNEEKKKYDAFLAQNEVQRYLVYVKLNLEELDFDDCDVAHYPCRCGSWYVIDKKSVKEDNAIIIECEECSYVIEVNK